MEQQNDFLVLKNVTKSFGKATVIDNLNLSIKKRDDGNSTWAIRLW